MVSPGWEVFSDKLLGGHSLLATQVISRVREAFQVELSLRTFLEAPTIADLSHSITSNEAKPGQTERIAQTLIRIAGMSTEDIRMMLQEKIKKGLHGER